MLDMIIKKEGTDSKPGATASLLRHLDKLSELEIAVHDFAGSYSRVSNRDTTGRYRRC